MTRLLCKKNIAMSLITVLSAFLAVQSFASFGMHVEAQEVITDQTASIADEDSSAVAIIESSSSSNNSESSSSGFSSSSGQWGCGWSSSSSSSSYSSSSSSSECGDGEELIACSSSSSSETSFTESSQESEEHGGHGAHLGNDTTSRLHAIINFIAGGGHSGVPDGAFGGGVSGPFTADEKAKICAVKNSKFIGDIHIVAGRLAELLAEVLGRPDASQIVKALEDPNFCPAPETVSAIESQSVVAIRVNADGYLVTSNPVVNACMRGKATLGLIQHNTDKVMNRQGAIVTYRPRSCSDYHHGSDNVWLHPDYLSLHVTLNDKGQLKEDALPKDVLVMHDAGPGFVAIGNLASK